MANKYFVWKDPNCNGENIEWIEMTGVDFVDFSRLPENQNRYFIRLGNEICIEADVIVLETTAEKYRAWKSSSNSHNYLATHEKAFSRVSLDAPIAGEDDLSLADLIASDDDMEEAVFHRMMFEYLSRAMMFLDADEKTMLMRLYAENISLKQLATEMGIPRKTLEYRREKIFEKIKKLFASF